MKKLILVAFTVLAGFVLVACQGAGMLTLPTKGATQSALAQEKVLPDVKLYFAGETHPTVVSNLGAIKTSQRTSSVQRGPVEACRRVMVSALIQLQKQAKSRGGNAVINIRSNWQNRTLDNGDEFQCQNGAMMSGVALTGEAASL